MDNPLYHNPDQKFENVTYGREIELKLEVVENKSAMNITS